MDPRLRCACCVFPPSPVAEPSIVVSARKSGEQLVHRSICPMAESVDVRRKSSSLRLGFQPDLRFLEASGCIVAARYLLRCLGMTMVVLGESGGERGYGSGSLSSSSSSLRIMRLSFGGALVSRLLVEVE